ncbi:hypothetical protein [Chrysodeixis includens nucleopolyhedrovirus]|uniref:Uncharacterized protein n=1 Tax=Chrysodeixis includens nucleopolyhedrovirus TaxID=1207438 RepID=A0A5B8YS46_9ABAC|nr:hypothetical protein QKU06_gp005 [Chrysodeixis includens nucleopolyhedrovirus]QED40533.1 hypothetical protein [Chrysodeixis includens nucleopolyhedrovirus]
MVFVIMNEEFKYATLISVIITFMIVISKCTKWRTRQNGGRLDKKFYRVFLLCKKSGYLIRADIPTDNSNRRLFYLNSLHCIICRLYTTI